MMNAPDPFALGGDGDPDAETHEIAAIDFEPVDTTALITDLTEPVWGAMIAGIGTDLRMAALVVRLRKPEAVDLARTLLAADDGEGLFQMLDRIGDTMKRLEYFAEIGKAAFCRLQISASVVITESEEKADGGDHHIAEWIRLEVERTKNQMAQLAPAETAKVVGRGHRRESGINAAARELKMVSARPDAA